MKEQFEEIEVAAKNLKRNYTILKNGNVKNDAKIFKITKEDSYVKILATNLGLEQSNDDIHSSYEFRFLPDDIIRVLRVKYDEMNEIVICKYCSKPEYYGEMKWLSGSCSCRNCYKAKWQDENHKIYTWDDLDGKRPTIEEYNIANNIE